MTRFPAWMRSVRFRMALLYSVIVFGLAALILGSINVALQRSLAGEPLSAQYVVSLVSGGNGLPLRLERRVVETQFVTLERLVNERALDNLRAASYVTLGALFPLSVLVGWLVAGRALQPIDRITRVAREIQSSDLSRRIGLEGPDDELRALADTFDDMLDRIEQGADEQRAFIQDTSHELRNPLAVMATTLDVALADPDADVEAWRHTGQVVRRTVDRTARTVDELVTFARREHPAHEHTPVNLDELTSEVLDEFAASADRRSIELERRSGEAPVVEVDRNGIKKALANLVGNAIRLVPDGARVVCGAGVSGGWAWVGVRDAGPGIAPEHHRLVFRRHWGGSRGREPEESRSGLGLAIVRQIVESHGGQVTLTSVPDRGSSFVIWLPYGEESARRAVSSDGIHADHDPLWHRPSG